MLLAEPDQMAFFDEFIYEDLPTEAMQAPASSHPSGAALAIALVIFSWLPIALLIWLFT